MMFRRLFRSLYWKLSAIFLVLLLLVGAAYTYLTIFSSEMYVAEATQRINVAVARHIVDDIQPFVDGKPDVGRMNQLFHNVMVVNPSVEVYLLDAEGNILTFDAPKEKVKLTAVSLGPIDELLTSDGKKLVLGDNPRDIHTPKVFSAAPVTYNGKTHGYVYVILRGEEYDSIADRIGKSHILMLGLRGLLVSLIAAGVIGLVALGLVTKKLQQLTRTAIAFKEGDYSQRVRITSRDELDELGRAFNAMADALSRHVEELERSDRLRRELIANVSHDLRTPLASMQGYLETVLMEDFKLSPEERRTYLGTIFSNAKRLSTLVQELFELSKLEAKETLPHAEPFSLPDLANDLAQKFAPMAKAKGVELTVCDQEHLPLVTADIGLIDRVLQNLLDNALRHTGTGGTIRIIIEKNDNKIRTLLEDTGVGISDTDLPHVFERFYQSRIKGETGGAGLGLAIVRRILEAHGETIRVESQLDKGTRFIFDLPQTTSTKYEAA